MEPQGFLAASAFVSNLVFRTVAHVEKGIPKYKVGNGITAGKQGLRRQGCSPQKGKHKRKSKENDDRNQKNLP